MVNVNIDIFPSNSGKIDLNSIQLNEFPWQGIYYNGCEISCLQYLTVVILFLTGQI